MIDAPRASGPGRRVALARTLLLCALLWAAPAACVRTAPPVSAGQPAVARGVRMLSYTLDPPGTELPYALFVPSRYEASKAAPLIVLLHGLGSNPEGVIRYQGITEEAERRGYIVAAPAGYNSHGWYGSLGPGNEFSKRFQSRRPQPEPDPENLGELSEQDVLHVLDRVRSEYKVDPDRIYLMGHSMGGGGTLYLAMKYGSRWAAIGALAPAIYSDPAGLEKIRTLPAIVVQGDADALVRVDNTRRWVDMMEKLGMPHEYIEIAGGDHVRSIASNPEMIHRVFDFFDAHRRGVAERGS